MAFFCLLSIYLNLMSTCVCSLCDQYGSEVSFLAVLVVGSVWCQIAILFMSVILFLRVKEEKKSGCYKESGKSSNYNSNCHYE